MELGLSLGGDEAHKPFKLFGLLSKEIVNVKKDDDGLGFCMGLAPSVGEEMSSKRLVVVDTLTAVTHHHHQTKDSSSDELHLLPFSPPPHHKPPSHQLPLIPWLSHNQNCKLNGSGLIRKHGVVDEEEVEGGGTDSSSPDSSIMSSSFRMEFGILYDRNKNKINGQGEMERDSNSRGASDEEEMNGGLLGTARKKLRLTKDQSAFLEHSFKEHHTLNPKQKLGLAKQLNLRPRQVEVWFQNRRARTKLKQTEVDCEYLKRCCETLTQDNRRLQKELEELRALKSSKPFYMQLPATTLTMCPSCERVASTTTTTAVAAPPATKPRLHPFLQDQVHALQASS